MSALVCGLGLAGSVVASAHSAHPASASQNVNLKNFGISPSKLKIKAGTKVTWHWLDAQNMGDHNVTSKAVRRGLRFKGSVTKTRGTYSVTFKKPGTYYYQCTIHPFSMQGVIVVK